MVHRRFSAVASLIRRLAVPDRGVLVVMTCGLVGSLVGSSAMAQGSEVAVESAASRVGPIPIIAAGTPVVARSESDRWNRLVLLAEPKISSGDIDALSGTLRDAATVCSLTLMATVETVSVSTSKPSPRFELKSIGVGYSAQATSGPWANQQVVISPETAEQLGVELGFIAKQVLKTNQAQLANVSLIAMTDQMAVFDAPSVMHRGGVNRNYRTRHFVYVDPTTGQGGMISWLLVPTTKSDEQYPIIKNPIRATPWGKTELRKIHVDEDDFNLFGIPGELAFGLEDLPPGIDLDWTKRAARIAGQTTYTAEELNELSLALREILLSSSARSE